MSLIPKMSENDYRELFLAMRRQPHLARPILDELRKDPKHLRYEPAVLAARRQGTTLRWMAEDFGVSGKRVGQIQARCEHSEKREQQARAAMEKDPSAGPISLLALDERTTRALESVGIQRLGDAAAWSDDDLLSIHDLGRKGLRRIREALTHFGFCPTTKSDEPGIDATHLDLTTIGVEKWLDVRLTNALMNSGILTIADLVSWTRKDLKRLRNLGPVSATRISKCLASRGLALAKKT